MTSAPVRLTAALKCYTRKRAASRGPLEAGEDNSTQVTTMTISGMEPSVRPSAAEATPPERPIDCSGSAPPSVPHSSRRVEVWVAAVLTAIILCLHGVRLTRAGALWRDEAAAVGLATLPSLSDVVRHFPHEAFPLLVPAAIRLVAEVSGDRDAGYRLFGMLVGLSIIAALWWNLWTIRRGVPLLSLALVGFNGAFIVWGDSVRGYGLGTLFIILTVGLFWRLVERPTPWRIAGATLGAVASVQCLLHNPPLLLAIGLGAIAVAIRRGALRRGALVVAIGAAAAASLLPYWGLLQRARAWDVLVRKPIGVGDLWFKLNDTLGASGWSIAWIWVLLFWLGLLVCLGRGGALRAGASAPPGEDRDLRLFAGIALVTGVVGCFGFLKVLSYGGRPWYFEALVGLAAVLLDLIIDTVRRQRWTTLARLTLAALIAVTSLPLTWQQVRLRQTNVDLVAAQLGLTAGAGDLILVTPWYRGVSFERYYRGSAAWMTLPPIDFHRFHRFDLVQAQMALANQDQVLQPVLLQIDAALSGGHRVWVIGTLESSPAEEAATTQTGASAEKQAAQLLIRSAEWSMNVGSHLRERARHMEPVRIQSGGLVNPLEDLPLTLFEGWAKP